MNINRLNYKNDDGIFANIKDVVNNHADLLQQSSDPDWITALNWNKITDSPTTLGGYGILDAQPLNSGLTEISALNTQVFGRALLTYANAAAVKTALELATVATSASATDLTSGTLAAARLPATVVQTTGSYADPAWITALAASKITGTLMKSQQHAQTAYKDEANIWAQAQTFDGTVSCPQATDGERFGVGASVANYSTSVGKNATCTTNGVAVGAASSAAHIGVAVGWSSSAGSGAMALGTQATGIVTTIAIGYQATTTNLYAVALGNYAEAAYYSTALGYTTKANNSYSIALGAHAETTANNQLAIGSSTAPISQVTFPGSNFVTFSNAANFNGSVSATEFRPTAGSSDWSQANVSLSSNSLFVNAKNGYPAYLSHNATGILRWQSDRVEVLPAAASTGVGTGALQVAGGIYAGAGSHFADAVRFSSSVASWGPGHIQASEYDLNIAGHLGISLRLNTGNVYGGTEVAKLTSTGATFNGNIVQDVGAGSNTIYQLGTADSNVAYMTIGGGGSIARWADGHTYINGVSNPVGTQIVLFSSNTVAIGTNTTPTTKFHVEGTSKFTADATFQGITSIGSLDIYRVGRFRTATGGDIDFGLLGGSTIGIQSLDSGGNFQTLRLQPNGGALSVGGAATFNGTATLNSYLQLKDGSEHWNVRTQYTDSVGQLDFFNTGGAAKFSLRQNGNATFGGTLATGGSITSGGSLIVPAGSGTYYDSSWIEYKNASDPRLYIRDAVNSRMQVTYEPGVNATSASTTIHSRLVVEEDATFNADIASNSITTGLVYTSGVRSSGEIRSTEGFWATGPYPHGSVGTPGVISNEYPFTRNMIGDGSGYSWALSKRAGGVTTDVLTVNDASELVSVRSSLTTGGAATFNGQVSAASGLAVSGKIQISNNASGFGFALTNGNSQFYSSSTAGLIIAGAGSTSDVLVTNKSGSDVLSVPTGTRNVNFAGAVGVGVSPTAQLDMSGGYLRIRGGSGGGTVPTNSKGLELTFDSTTNIGYVFAVSRDGAGAYPLSLGPTANPLYIAAAGDVTVNGNVNCDTATYPQFALKLSGVSKGMLWYDSVNSRMTLGSGSTSNGMSLDASGNATFWGNTIVGSGTSSPIVRINGGSTIGIGASIEFQAAGSTIGYVGRASYVSSGGINTSDMAYYAHTGLGHNFIVNGGFSSAFSVTSAGNITATGTAKLGDFTVATLPSAASNTGHECNVTDSSVTTFGSTVAGGGSNNVKVRSNGTNWTVTGI